jgi:hypothetical protein
MVLTRITKISSALGRLLAQGLGFNSIAQAASSLLRHLYGTPLPLTPQSRNIPPKTDRNEEIYKRYMAGERAVDLAKEFGVSVRRINRLINRYKKQNLE